MCVVVMLVCLLLMCVSSCSRMCVCWLVIGCCGVVSLSSCRV